MNPRVQEVVHLAQLCDETERELRRHRQALIDAMLALPPAELAELRELRKVAQP